MGSRQLVRVAAVVVAAVALAFLGFKMVSSSEDVTPTAATADPGDEYAALVADLQSLLTAYAPLQAVSSHDQVHDLSQDLAGLEIALTEVEDRAAELGTPEADEVGALAALVRQRAATVRYQASADHNGSLGGVALVQAFAREAALRAVEIGDALAVAPQEGYAEVFDAVAAPWPAPRDEGLGG